MRVRKFAQYPGEQWRNFAPTSSASSPSLWPPSRRELEAARRLRRARTRGRPVVVQLPDGVLSGAVGRVARTAGIACVGEDVVRLRDVVSIRKLPRCRS